MTGCIADANSPGSSFSVLLLTKCAMETAGLLIDMSACLP